MRRIDKQNTTVFPQSSSLLWFQLLQLKRQQFIYVSFNDFQATHMHLQIRELLLSAALEMEDFTFVNFNHIFALSVPIQENISYQPKGSILPLPSSEWVQASGAGSRISNDPLHLYRLVNIFRSVAPLERWRKPACGKKSSPRYKMCIIEEKHTWTGQTCPVTFIFNRGRTIPDSIILILFTSCWSWVFILKTEGHYF